MLRDLVGGQIDGDEDFRYLESAIGDGVQEKGAVGLGDRGVVVGIGSGGMAEGDGDGEAVGEGGPEGELELVLEGLEEVEGIEGGELELAGDHAGLVVVAAGDEGQVGAVGLVVLLDSGDVLELQALDIGHDQQQ